MRAAAALGPKARTPTSKQASTRPSTSGASGPTTTRSQRSSPARRTSPATSSAATSKQGTLSRAIPALPGAAMISGCCGLRSNARTSACSRPPLPTTRIRFRSSVSSRASERSDEVVDRDRRQRLIAAGPARPELKRHTRDRLLVGRLEDVDEVVLAERRPLRLDRCPQLLDLLVDFANPRRVVLERLNAFRRQGGEQDVGGHLASVVGCGCLSLSFGRGMQAGR